MNPMKTVFLLALSFLLVTHAGFRKDARGAEKNNGSDLTDLSLAWAPEAVAQGSVVRFFVDLPEGLQVRKGDVDGTELHFSPLDDPPGRLQALYGVDAEKKPEQVDVTLWISGGEDKDPFMLKKQIRIQARDFGREDLTLPDSKVHLSEESLKRVRRESREIRSLWPRSTPERLWDGPFLIPVTGRPGSPFGLRRWINGERRSFHTGMDIKAPQGTPVRASNSGRVVLVGDHFFGGNSVFVDHGQGIYSMYFHLSSIDVGHGQDVQKGQTLGRVGMTGRATGPHLHWGVRVGGARVDPEALIENTRELSAGR